MMRGIGMFATALAVPMTMTAAMAAPAPLPRPSAGIPKPLAGSQATTPQTPPIRRLPMSEEGNAVARKMLATPDSRAAAIQGEMAAIRQQKLQMLAGATVDIDWLEPMLRREEALQTEYRARQNDRLIALLRALPEPDRVAFLQMLASSQRTQAAKSVDPVN